MRPTIPSRVGALGVRSMVANVGTVPPKSKCHSREAGAAGVIVVAGTEASIQRSPRIEVAIVAGSSAARNARATTAKRR
jgi:hypothetical protein